MVLLINGKHYKVSGYTNSVTKQTELTVYRVEEDDSLFFIGKRSYLLQNHITSSMELAVKEMVKDGESMDFTLQELRTIQTSLDKELAQIEAQKMEHGKRYKKVFALAEKVDRLMIQMRSMDTGNEAQEGEG